ncbi:ATP-binding protein [Alkalinema pantanalense CENA528]|uniref:ATP-binding protein n=1 Tax=Alkalinema pantanalense TaxID=1620705 RepID=UPI003D6FF833
MTQTKLPKRISTALVNALGSGVVPRLGVEHIAVGRDRELATLSHDLSNIAAGGASFRFVIGRYGAGKSFLLQLLRSQALEQGFVVADADITPERRLAGAGGASVATYRELLHHLSTKSRPDGGALQTILERWIAAIQTQVAQDTGKRPNDDGFDGEVEAKIREVTQDVVDLVNGFEFANVIIAYWTGYRSDNEVLKESALRWLRGEFATKTEAKSALGVRVIVDDETWYDYVKLLAKFVADIGYKGLIVLIDEAIHLTKITTTVTRQNNYDKLLAMFNDTMQGRVSYLGIIVGGTPQFLEDPRRGLYSDPAWQRRTSQNRLLSQSGLTDAIAPVVRLEPLTPEQLLQLLQRLAEIHRSHYDYAKPVATKDLQQILQTLTDRLGAEALLTPGELVRDVIGVLNVLHQNPTLSVSQLFQSASTHPALKSPAQAQIDPKSLKSGPQSTVSSEFAEFTL